jgi:hypothetical protein
MASRLSTALGSCCLAILVLALSSCGSSASSTSAGAPNGSGGSAPSAATTPTSTSSSGAGPATSSRTSPGGGLRPCRASQLSLSFLGQQGATGQGELGFVLRNVGAHSCHTIGYPGILFLDRAGVALPTTPMHTTHDFFGLAPVRSIILAPGGRASFRLGVTHGINSSAGCTTAYGLQVIPPNDTATLRIAIPQGGAYECRTATVSPLRPGTSAYP